MAVTDSFRDWYAQYPERRVFGYLCSYAPVELLHAAGFAPVRLGQASASVTKVDAHLPSFCCALARSVTEQMLRGELDSLEGVLFTHACDTMQCLADVWRMTKPRFAVIHYSSPSAFGQPSVQEYWETELKRLAMVLESEFGVPLREDALRASIALYNRQRRLLAAACAHLDRLSAEQGWWMLLSGTHMPVEQHVAWLQEEEIHTRLKQVGCVMQPRLLLVGAVLDDPLLPRLIDELGATVVGFDLCTGSRYGDVEVNENKEPYEALAERYTKRAPCPCKHVNGHDSSERLQQLVSSTRAEAVVFVLPKYCDPHAFEYVQLAQALSELGVAHLRLETELTVSVAQWRTRLQAFFEMLRDRYDRETLLETPDGR